MEFGEFGLFKKVYTLQTIILYYKAIVKSSFHFFFRFDNHGPFTYFTSCKWIDLNALIWSWQWAWFVLNITDLCKIPGIYGRWITAAGLFFSHFSHICRKDRTKNLMWNYFTDPPNGRLFMALHCSNVSDSVFIEQCDFVFIQCNSKELRFIIIVHNYVISTYAFYV